MLLGFGIGQTDIHSCSDASWGLSHLEKCIAKVWAGFGTKWGTGQYISMNTSPLLCRIVQYALQRHLPGGSTVSSQAGCLDSVLQSKHAEANAQVQASR